MTAILADDQVRKTPPRLRRSALARFARNREAVLGLLVLALVVLVSVLAPWLAPHDPNAGDAENVLAPIGSAGHLLGTDDQGRDVLSRVVHGGRSALMVSTAAVAVALVAGTALGLFAAFAGRRVSGVLMRVVDLMFAFPVILVALSLAAVLRPGSWVLIGTVVFAALPYVTRIVFAEAKVEREKDYVEAARSLGASESAVVWTEVLPNLVSSVVIYGTSLVGVNIVFTASLSALGLGIQPPDPDWGRMISEGAKVLVTGNPGVATFPAAAILLVALAFNWLGDGLRDVLNP
ncbi:peptide/nickel transport system permease protein [Actinocorallia herbida]|uniref:Peptide/nickel transport system permease protein n=1 Tax=Actinocorallia herbida TaxID=58109 RepID=A0A3N1CX78_9ACTN|nr:ABC transporter permease [Actinocorallia herbida]ROO85874.1 peptide/nickel transport system permease protein [Actinocorallia herbida]